ncbi:MAG: dTMP kinase [bacterium]
MIEKGQFKGKLIVVEGVDGSGKTTQLRLLQNWMESQGHAVYYTRRRTSKLVAKAIEKAKGAKTLSSITYSLIHAADFADRLVNNIIPSLQAGIHVLADRYIYTSFARDVVRGNDREWVRELYSFAVEPDMTVYFQVPVEVSLERISTYKDLDFYDAGMDIGLSRELDESFRLFQGKVIEEYNKMADEFGFFVMDGTKLIHEQQRVFREKVRELLPDLKGD